MTGGKSSRKAAFLTMDDLTGFECYDHLLIEPLKKLSWDVENISWRRSGVDWNLFDVVIVRSTWDYQLDPDSFISVLTDIDASKARLENNLKILKWNMNKRYLYQLEGKGVNIVRTIWADQFNAEAFGQYFDTFGQDEIIIKPTVSANADNTFRILNQDYQICLPQLERIFKNRSFMVQPFIPSIINEGEYSLFYFGGEFSHAVLKKPKENDFRVQEEHGGIISSVVPSKLQLIEAERILSRIHPLPLYARIDLVRTQKEDFALMELELIEPSLYFNMDEESPYRFANTLDNWIK